MLEYKKILMKMRCTTEQWVASSNGVDFESRICLVNVMFFQTT